ncbi:MAG TPA: Hsp70 family protein, partial [Candidatus Angelobacter sp.]|nr:Hsp70 family protein [Candidatus Angelobacter sp.]
MSKAIGIDLGTTNSVACYFDGHAPRVLLNANHEELTPSVVGLQQFDPDEEAEILVGRPAVSQAKLYPADTIFSIKRLMGRKYGSEDVQRWREKVAYKVVEAQSPSAGLAAVVLGEKQYLPEDISALILREVRSYSRTSLSDDITHAVITVPAYFGEPERAATREAGKKAGLVVKTLLPEPTAAAIAFGLQTPSKDGSIVLVFDLGGGTFDISIISMVGTDYNVMEIHGDHFLGGDDFDMEIVAMILEHVKKTDGVDLSQDRRFLIIAKAEAEAAKKSLSSLATDSVRIQVPEAARVGDKVINLKLKVTRAEFESAIQPLVRRCKDLVQEALDRQSMKPDLINDVLLVGGSTAVPLVYKTMEEMFPNKVRRDVNPMYCVAIGAGILAHNMQGIECPDCKRICDEAQSECPDCHTSLAAAKSVLKDMELTEITANHFGIQVVSGSDANTFRILVEKGTQLPMSEAKKETFFTTEEGQALIRVPVYEGIGANVTQNKAIGEIEYNLPAALPTNTPVHVDFRLDRQSIVTVTIQVQGFPFHHEQELKRGESAPDVAESIDDSPVIDDEETEMEKQQRQFGILEAYIERAKHFLIEYDRILTEVQKRKLQEAINHSSDVLVNEKSNECMDAVMNLDRLLLRCGTASLVDQAHFFADQADQEIAAR